MLGFAAVSSLPIAALPDEGPLGVLPSLDETTIEANETRTLEWSC